MRAYRIALAFGLCGAVILGGCGSWFENDKSTAQKQEEQKARDEKTREAVAKATENAKPMVQEAGKKLGEVARSAAETAKAAAQGMKEGWQRGKNAPVDLNSASESELTGLPGITPRLARKIIAGRPYKNTQEMVSRRLMTEEAYSRISDAVVAR